MQSSRCRVTAHTEGIQPTNAFAQLLSQSTAQAQHVQYGDGGLMCLILTARMVQAALQVSATRQDLYETCCAVQAVGDRLSELLLMAGSSTELADTTVAALHVPCQSLHHYMALCRGVLSPKLSFLLTEAELEQLVLLVCEAFVLTLPNQPMDAGGADTSAAMRVPVHVLHGSTLHDSCVLPGVVLPADEVPLAVFASFLPGKASGTLAGSHAPPSPVGMMLFSGELDGSLRDPNTAAGIRTQLESLLLAEQSGILEPGDDEEQRLQLTLTALERMMEPFGNVRLFVCQKGISPVVQEWLVSRGIASLQRLGAASISALSLITGCPLLATLGKALVAPGTAPGTSACVHVELKEIGARRLLLVMPAASANSSPRPSATLVLGAPSDALSSQVQQAVEAALRLLHGTLLQAPTMAVAGGGAIELALAKTLDAWSTRLGGTAPQVNVIRAAAAALRELAYTLSPSHVRNSLTEDMTLSGLQGDVIRNNIAAQGSSTAPGDDQRRVLDSLPSKVAAFRRSTDTAIQLLRLTGM
ncbi:Thermosome subunit alpha [Tetrabaena socialis]|uniref:Thermosome subunit alpha n=1 Tax=Tetrabaena socialis TaxID=47790 RepID=A0A2J7ZZX6_9CHLO|nr:Thermosome subunit alpha [Tetrabaena socialis]|eukprot:PNH05809.1 Thermosome subunit alpha [Tetrabaena socialis]